MRYPVRIDRFSSADHLTGKARTYEAVRAAVLAAGRCSTTFEASEAPSMFTALQSDKSLTVTRDQYPWYRVALAGEPAPASRR